MARGVMSFVFFFFFLLTFSTAHGDIINEVVANHETRFLEYEGVLTGSEGERMTGEYEMTFRVFGSATSSDALWEETHPVVVKNGAFQVTLGRNSKLPLSGDKAHYIGISVGDEELSPRQLIRTVIDDDMAAGLIAPPVNLTSPGAEGPPIATPYGSSGGWTDDGPVVRLTTVSDSVGIGTTSPSTVLDVVGSTTSLEGIIKVRNDEGGVALRGVSSSSSSESVYGSYVTGSNTGTGWAFGSSSHGQVLNDEGWAYGVIGLGESNGPGLAFGGLFSAPDSGTGAHYGVQALALGSSENPTVGVHGFGQNTSNGDAYGGFFETSPLGTEGGNYGLYALGKGGDNVTTYGIYCEADNTGSGEAYGGYFNISGNGSGRSLGIRSHADSHTNQYVFGVYASAQNTGSGPAYAGYFEAYSYGSGTHYCINGYEAAGGSGAAVYAAGDQFAPTSKSTFFV